MSLGRPATAPLIMATYVRGSVCGFSPSAAHLLAQRRVAEVGDINLVDLQIAAAGSGEIAHLLAVDAREVGIELRHVRIGLLVDRRAAAAKMHVARRRDRQLRRYFSDRLHVLEVIDKDRVRPGELAGDLQGLRRIFHRALLTLEPRLDLGRNDFDVGELPEEVDVPGIATELAIGRRLQADIFLKFHRLADRLILHGAQLFR